MKPLRLRRLPVAVALYVAFVSAAVALGTSHAGAQAPPPPPVPNPSATPLPTLPPATEPPASPAASASPTATPKGKRGKSSSPAPSAAPDATATPTSPAFATLDGTWEVQEQYTDRTDYSYLTLAQTAQTLSGTWKVKGKPFALDGTYDGRLIRMVVKEPSGTVTLSGYVEGASDMVGLIDDGNGKPVAFTAEHRAAPPKGILRRTP